MIRKTVVPWLILLSMIAAPAWAEMGSIGRDRANVRSGPGQKYRVIYKAPLGYPVEVTSRQKGWLKIRDMDGQTGWISESLVSKTRTAVVLKERVNVRKAPGTATEVLGQVEKGDIYKVMAEESNWIQIGYYHEGEAFGWIREDLVFGD